MYQLAVLESGLESIIAEFRLSHPNIESSFKSVHSLFHHQVHHAYFYATQPNKSMLSGKTVISLEFLKCNSTVCKME